MRDFDIVCQFDEVGILEKGETDDPGVMRMYGWASTGAKDSDAEKVLQDGLDLSDVVQKGWANWNHQSEKIIGIPRVCELRSRKENGTDFGKCVYTEFDLLKGHPLAQEIWTLANALKDTDRSLGLSLEGKKILKKGSSIVKAKVMNIAIAPNPKNSQTTVQALVKALGTEDAHAFDLFAPVDFSQSEIVGRVESVVSAALTKAIDAGYAVGGTDQSGGAAIRTAEHDRPLVDLVAFPMGAKSKLMSLDAPLQRIGNALANIAGTRGGKLTKAEAALFTFLVTDATLPECFTVFGVE